MENENRRGINERIRKLRNESMSTLPSLSLERALLLTEVYRDHEGTVSFPMLRALSLQKILAEKELCINDGELIVGERGPGPQSAPTYPELCCHTLDDLKIIDNREKISFKVSDELLTQQQEIIIPYWKGRSVRDLILQSMTGEWLDCYEAGIFTEFMEQRAPGHTVADNKIYNKGMVDFQNEIKDHLRRIESESGPEVEAKREQLQAMSICAEAIISYARRHADMAMAMARLEEDEKRQEELIKVGNICYKVPAHAPETFHEALQAYWFIHIGVITELNTWDAFCPGRLDQHLWPFYQLERENGTLSRDEAKELLECFWIKFNNQPAPPKVGITLKESATYTDFANINLGGLKPDGTDGVNEVTYLLLEVIDEMKLLQPSTNIQVSKKSPDHFIREAARVIRKGWGQPSVFNVEAIIQEMLLQGKELIDARSGGTSGCVETGAFGKESYILTGYFNLTKILEITLNNGFNPADGKQLGLKTGKLDELDSFEKLMSAYNKQLEHFINIKITGNHFIEKLYAEKMPAPFLSLLIDDCIKNGKDYNAGGARYNTNYIQGVGIGSLTDSLSALKKHVYNDKKYDLMHLKKLLDENYSGSEATRLYLINKTPRYGNDDPEADEIMQEIFKMFYQQVNGRKTYRGGTYRINMLPTTSHVYFGSVIGATPDGRKAGSPLSEGISPVQGADRKGPSAVIKSASKMDHLLTGGTLLNLKFTPKILEGNRGLDYLLYIIRTYFRMDGHHIQFNVIDAETLKEAQAFPEKHRNLIVRVAGYSDYFNNLNKQLQEEIIARTAHGL